MIRVYIDFDEVIADLHTEWVRRYNNTTGEELGAADITDWDFPNRVKEPQTMWNLLRHPNLYDYVEPKEGAIEGMKAVMADPELRVMIASSCPSTTMIDGKLRWLRRHGLLDGMPDHGWPDLFIPIRDKGLLKGEVLVDDRPENLAGFGGARILFDAAHNQGDHPYHRVFGWGGVLRILNGT